MTDGYQPIFRSILQSSIARDYVVRHVFEDLLKLADWLTGEVDMTHDAIARQTGMPEEMVRDAIAKLEMPDPESRNKAEEGRRLVRLDPDRPWGWAIVNFVFYREQVQLAGKRRRQAKYREQKAEREGRGEEFRRLRISRDGRSVTR